MCLFVALRGQIFTGLHILKRAGAFSFLGLPERKTVGGPEGSPIFREVVFRMEKPVIQVSSVTYAIKSRDLLFRYGIRAYVERSTRSSRAGCGYGLYVPENTDRAEQILRRAHIRVLGRIERSEMR